jgi:hypothetical protein
LLHLLPDLVTRNDEGNIETTHVCWNCFKKMRNMKSLATQSKRDFRRCKWLNLLLKKSFFLSVILSFASVKITSNTRGKVKFSSLK